MTIKIRRMYEDDWPAIWPFLQADAAAGEAFTYPRDMGEALGRAIWMQGAAGCNLVAIDDAGRLVGAAKVGANQLGPGAHVATASFIVAASARRTGAGRALAQSAINWATENGFAAMQFNAVVETNKAAVTLWQSLGFTVIGTVPRAFCLPGGEMVGLHIMHRDL